ncbi:hypothetical protein EV2_037392 [Malus domestica]
MALEEASSQIQNQALTALEEITSPIQDQVSTTLESKPSSRISCGKSTIGGIQKTLQPSSRSKLWKVNKRNKIRADSPTTQAKYHLPHEAPCGPISTFKIKPRRPLKKFQTKVQDQASTALGSTSTVRDFKTHLLHVTSTSLKHPGSRRIKKMFFVLRSSFFQDQASTALGSTIIHFQDQAPTAP